MGSEKAKKRTAKAAGSRTSITMALPATNSAWSFFLSPSRIEIRAVAPTPIRMDKPMMMVMTGKATATAASPREPTPRPTNIRATILYKAFTTMPTMAGKEKFHNRRPMFSLPIISERSIIIFTKFHCYFKTDPLVNVNSILLFPQIQQIRFC